MKACAAILITLLLFGCSDVTQNAVNVTVIGPKAKLVDPSGGAMAAPALNLAGVTMQGLVRFNAAGEIVPGLAESWIVTDDGLSYIFRMRRAKWPDGTNVNADHAAQSLRRSLTAGSRNPLRAFFSSVVDIVAMTDRVIEIRLRAPQPNILQLLAQPQMGILRRGRGSGPLHIYRTYPNSVILRPNQALDVDGKIDEATLKQREIRFRGESAAVAIMRFKGGEALLVLGGGYDDLPLAQAARLPSTAFRRDLVPGLFGFVVSNSNRVLADAKIRGALSMAINRRDIVDRFRVPGWQIQETFLPAAIGMTGAQSQPDWATLDLSARRQLAKRLVADARKSSAPIRIRLALPGGSGSSLLFAGLRADWSLIGLDVVRVHPGEAADLYLIDAVATVHSAGWYIGRLSCNQGFQCSAIADAALVEARAALDPVARNTALIAADNDIVKQQIFIPIAAPLRWSLVAPRLNGYRENSIGWHPIDSLDGVE
jgi:oligopeptide transport system substrate-binding protein